MSRNILKEIVARRKKDIKADGFDGGFNIPAERSRPVHQFLAEKGVILEVKRASPSKGDIAPSLDSYATAYEYAKNGARAISCLTEKNWFKGTLEDLMKVCAAVDAFERDTGLKGPAVLRKDFLFDVKDVEIAYRAGADAVLLIARILSARKMLAMAKKAEELGISVLIEIRKDSDVKKLEHVMQNVSSKNIVCGVNSRDLKNFTVDTLVPAVMLERIRKVNADARVVFESGILSPNAAAFAGGLGFSGILLGEAAAKNPEKAGEFIKAFESTNLNANGKFWLDYASKLGQKNHKPFVKICGNTNAEDAVLAARNGADMLGFIIWPKSKRNVDCGKIREIREAINNLAAERRGMLFSKGIALRFNTPCFDAERRGIKPSARIKASGLKMPKFVGVIVEPESEAAAEAYQLVKEGILDAIQVHTFEAAKAFLQKKELAALPHYCAVNISDEADIAKLDELAKLGEPRILVDAHSASTPGGTGKTIDEALLSGIAKKYRLWIAGGLSIGNIKHIKNTFRPELVDLVSSLEKEPGIKDAEKLTAFLEKM